MADKQAFEGLTGADLRKAYETLKKVHETKFIAGDNLKKSENTFAHERYSFEMIPGKSHSLQCSFLLTFSRMLNILAKSLK